MENCPKEIEEKSTEFCADRVWSLVLSALLKHPVSYLVFSIFGSSTSIFRALVPGGTYGWKDRFYFFVDLVVLFVFSGVVAFSVCKSISGVRVGMLEALGCTLDRFFSLLCIAFFYFVAIVFAGIAAFGAIAGIPRWIGALSLLILLFYFTLTYWIVVPVCAVENLTALESLKRSGELSRGHRYEIFWLTIVPSIAVGALNYVLQRIFPARFFMFGENIATTVMQPVYAMFYAVLVACIYYQLRVNAEASRDSGKFQ